MKSGRAFWQRTHQIHTVLLVIAVFVAGFVIGSQIMVGEAAEQPREATIGETDEAFEPFWEAFNAIQDLYIDNVEVPTLVDGAISGMIDALGDQYSGYMNPEIYPLFDADLSGDIEGIGVVIRTLEETGQIQVVNVLKGTPAMEAGVQPGDIFLEVDGESVIGLNQTELAARVRGPSGTTVNITFLRDEETYNVDIVRARIEIPNVETDILEGDIAYISMAEFNALAYDQLRDALEELDVNNRRGLIFDLRGNPGGFLRTAIDIASGFIEDGIILTEEFGNGDTQVFEATGNYFGIEVPIVVLVDERSASASELVAGAMQDRDVATLIGEQTFGKGTVQTVRELSNGGGIRLTIARWIRPSGQWIHEIGVEPDIVVEWEPEGFDDPEDPQLQAAIDFLMNENGE